MSACKGVECWCAEVAQDCHDVHKHEHFGGGACTRPWSALCQTRHGDICHTSDHTSQADAMTALCAHLARGVHIQPGDGDRATETPCEPRP